MFAPFVIGGLGLVLLVLLILVLRRLSASDAHQLQVALGIALPYRDPADGLLERVFDPVDLAFVSAENSPSLRGLLTDERRGLVLAWLAEIRREVSDILRRHRRSVRHLSDLRLGAEFRLALNSLAFYLGCLSAAALVRWYGAFATRAIIGHLLHLCSQLTRLHSQMRADILAEPLPALLQAGSL
jgi:hypothetical protein